MAYQTRPGERWAVVNGRRVILRDDITPQAGSQSFPLNPTAKQPFPPKPEDYPGYITPQPRSQKFPLASDAGGEVPAKLLSADELDLADRPEGYYRGSREYRARQLSNNLDENNPIPTAPMVAVPGTKPKQAPPPGVGAAFAEGAPVPASKPVEQTGIGAFFPGRAANDLPEAEAKAEPASIGNFFPGREANDIPAEAAAPGAAAEEGGSWADIFANPELLSLMRNVGVGILTNKDDPLAGAAMGLQNAAQETAGRQAEAKEDERYEREYQDDLARYEQRRGDMLDDRGYQRERDDLQRADQLEAQDYDRGRDLVGDERWQQTFDQRGEQLAFDRQGDLEDRAMRRARGKLQGELTRAQISKMSQIEPTGEDNKYAFGRLEGADGTQYKTREVKEGSRAGDIEYFDPKTKEWSMGEPEGAVRVEDGYMGDQNSADVRGFGKEFVQSGITARQGLQDTGRMLDLLETAKTNKAYFGPGAEGIQKFRQLAGAFGADTSNAQTIEQAVALAGDAMLQKMSMLGGNDSNEELKRIMALGFNPSDTLEGNIAKLKQVQAGLQYLQDRGDYAARYTGRPRDMMNSWNTSRTGKRIYEGLPGDGAASGKSNTTSSGVKWKIVE